MKDGFYTKKGEILKIKVVINYIILYEFNKGKKRDYNCDTMMF